MKPKTENSAFPLSLEGYSGVWMQPIKTADGQLIHVEVINGRPGESEKFAKLIISRVNSGPLVDRKLALANELAEGFTEIARSFSTCPSCCMDDYGHHEECWMANKVNLARQYQAIKEEA